MKRSYKIFLALILALAVMVCMTACGSKQEEEEAAGTGDTEAVETEPEEETETREVVKTIDGIDEDLGPRLPLMIESVTLYDDGTVAVVPLDELKKNEIKDDATAVYPFEESGEVSDVYVVDYGNGGYRTIIALMSDGTISAVNGRALVEDHIFAVMDTVAGRDNFVYIEPMTEEDGSTIVAYTDDGDSVVLDYSLNFDDPEGDE